MSKDTFCLDISDKITRIVDGEKKDSQFEIISAGSDSTAPNFYSLEAPKIIDTQANIIQKLYSTLKLKKKNAHVIIPDTYSFSQIIDMPKLNEKELLSAIRYQADQFIPMPIDEIALDLEILNEDQKNKKLKILIVASPKKTIEQIEKTLDLAGLYSESLENELSAAGRLFSELIKLQENGLYLLLNFGFSSSSIYLIDAQTSIILVSRTFKLGLELFIKEIKFNLSLDEPKSLEMLKTAGLAANSSSNIPSIVAPLLKDVGFELNKFMILAKDQYNLTVNKIFLYNYSNYIFSLDKTIEKLVSLPTFSLNLDKYLLKSPLSQSLASQVPSFISAIAGNLL